MKELIEEALPYVIGAAVIVTALWLIAALSVGVINAQNKMNWCQYKGGQIYYSSDEEKAGTHGHTGKRWAPNPITIGLTGECIDPGDKGL